MFFFTTLVVILITIPSDSSQRTDRLLYDLLALSNFSFWAEDSYFNLSAFKPLLNLWSLADELQFYLLAPFVLPFLHKRKALLTDGVPPFAMLTNSTFQFGSYEVSKVCNLLGQAQFRFDQ